MPSLLGILVSGCALIVATSAIQALGEEINDASLRSLDGAKVRQVREATGPSCSISILEDEAYGLTRLLNGFINVFAAKTEPAAVNSPRDLDSNIAINCASGISGLEISVWRILNRVWLATSCQYSENEFDEALREVVNEADQLLGTLSKVNVALQRRNILKMNYYNGTVSKVRATLVQVTAKMKEAQNSGRCHSSALQVYLSSGLAGLTGKSLNIENEHYKGEFLYLARNPNDRSASVYNDGATLAVGGDKLRESAFQWEFVRVPGEDSSVFYLHNKLNELKPIPSQEDYHGRWDYIRIETVSSPTVGEASQLVITMNETVDNKRYYHPHSTPNTNPALNGRGIYSDRSPSHPGTKWIVTLAS